MVSGSKKKGNPKAGKSQDDHQDESKYGWLRDSIGLVLIFMAGYNITSFHAYFQGLSAYVSNTAVTSTAVSAASFQLAFEQSYGFFDDISEQAWKMHQKWARAQGNHRHTGNPLLHWNTPAVWYYNNYIPVFACPHVKRIGGLGDGPKWVCDPHRIPIQAERRKSTADKKSPSNCLIYSFGGGGNYEFEDGFVAFNGPVCEIHIFDHRENHDRPENAAKNMHFHPWGLQGSQEQKGDPYMTFLDIVKRLGHEGRPIDIFKITCEGCEWNTYKDWVTYDVRQILVKTHKLPSDQKLGMDYFESYQRNNFLMFSKEVNGFGGGVNYDFSYIKLHPDFLHSQAK